MPRPLLIDTDPGIDDALALLLALASPEAVVEAITTVAGNVGVDRATLNALHVLAVAAPPARPRLGRGAAAPLARALVTAADVHGDDGLGGISAARDPEGAPRYPTPAVPVEMPEAVEVILEAAARLGPALTVVALGPLTNVARALRRDPARLRGIGRLVVMGGAVTVPGNVTPAAEFNVFVDPEAAAEVLAGELPVELVPLDATRQVCLGRAALEAALAGRADRRARFVADLTAHGFAHAEARGAPGIVLHDPLAVAAALDPGLLRWEALHVEVETAGRITTGQTLADRRPIAAARRGPPNCRVALGVDVARVERLFLERVCRASA